MLTFAVGLLILGFAVALLGVMLDGDEHCVNIYWYPETDEVFVERQD